MEKQMSVDERIRRAEEIYNKRTGNVLKFESKKNNNTQNTNKKIKKRKLLMQIFVCLIIYVVCYTIANWEYIFSDNFKNDVNIFFTEKTKIYQIYSDAKNYIKNNILGEDAENSEDESGNEQSTDDAGEEANTSDEEENQSNEEESSSEVKQTDEQANSNSDNENTEEAVGGAEEETTVSSEESQMEIDAKEIKEKISFIVPVEGTVSSTFGWRNPTVSTVPKYHTGLDIAAVSGTVIKSATDGTVILASSEGDYGNHYKIQIDDVVIIYAHCQTLYLNEGDTVSQGQEIAEVGSTGNSTGPHLHFEIRKDDRLVDPQLILDI